MNVARGRRRTSFLSGFCLLWYRKYACRATERSVCSARQRTFPRGFAQYFTRIILRGTDGRMEGRNCFFGAVMCVPRAWNYSQTPDGKCASALVRSFARLLVDRTKIRGPTRLRRVALSQLLPTAVSPRRGDTGNSIFGNFRRNAGNFWMDRASASVLSQVMILSMKFAFTRRVYWDAKLRR